MIKFSIIIPSFNYATLLPRAIESALTQTGDDFEVIVVDDGSTDNTNAVVASFSDKRLSYIYQTNQGAAAARNQGIRAAHGKYLLLLDADDKLLPNALSDFRAILAKDPTLELIVGGYRTIKVDGSVREHPSAVVLPDRTQNFLNYFRKKMAVANGATLMSRSFFETVSYPEKYRSNEDVPVFALSLALCHTGVLDKTVLEVYAHADSARHQPWQQTETHLQLVDEIFRPDLLSSDFMRHRQEVYSHQALSLFRSLWQRGEKKLARQFYHQAIKAYPRNLMRLSYLRKYMTSFL